MSNGGISDLDHARRKFLPADNLPTYMGLDIFTFKNQTSGAGPAQLDGVHWAAMSYTAYESLSKDIEAQVELFPTLKRIHYFGAIDFSEDAELRNLINEARRIRVEGKIYIEELDAVIRAAVHALDSGETVSFLGEAKFEY